MQTLPEFAARSLVPPVLRDTGALGDVTREELTLEAALGALVELFRDEDERPFIRLPPAAGGGLWPLASERVRGWLGELCWHWAAELLKPSEADAILRILDGRAWAVRRLDEVERDPLNKAILLLMSARRQWQGLMSELLAALTSLAQTHNLLSPKASWPGGPATLGSRLRQRIRLLERAGVTLEIRRTYRGTRVTLWAKESGLICRDGLEGAAHKFVLTPLTAPEEQVELRDAAPDGAAGGAPGVASCAAPGANSNGANPLAQKPDDTLLAAPGVASWVAPGLNGKACNHLPQNPGAPLPEIDPSTKKTTLTTPTRFAAIGPLGDP